GDASIRLWDTARGACVATLSGHHSWVSALTVLPAGRLASGSGDNSIRLWENAQRALTYANIQPLLTALATNTSVTSLNLSGVRLEHPTAVAGLQDLLWRNAHLTRVNVENTGLTPEALRVLYTSSRARTAP